jgi:hypothetical protein
MRGDSNAPLLSNLFEYLDKALVRQVGGGCRVPDPELAEESPELFVVEALGIDAQEVDPLARRKLEAGEYVNVTSRRGAPERGYAAHVVVIGDGEHRDPDFGGLVDDGLRMGIGIVASGPALKGPRVMMWIDL